MMMMRKDDKPMPEGTLFDDDGNAYAMEEDGLIVRKSRGNLLRVSEPFEVRRFRVEGHIRYSFRREEDEVLIEDRSLVSPYTLAVRVADRRTGFLLQWNAQGKTVSRLVFNADLGFPAQVARELRGRGLFITPTPRAQRALVVYLGLQRTTLVLDLYVGGPQVWMTAERVRQKAALLPPPGGSNNS
jgi:hypothetical protein